MHPENSWCELPGNVGVSTFKAVFGDRFQIGYPSGMLKNHKNSNNLTAAFF